MDHRQWRVDALIADRIPALTDSSYRTESRTQSATAHSRDRYNPL